MNESTTEDLPKTRDQEITDRRKIFAQSQEADSVKKTLDELLRSERLHLEPSQKNIVEGMSVHLAAIFRFGRTSNERLSIGRNKTSDPLEKRWQKELIHNNVTEPQRFINASQQASFKILS